MLPCSVCCRDSEWNGNTVSQKDKNESGAAWEKYV